MKKILVCMIVLASVSLGLAKDSKSEDTEESLKVCLEALSDCGQHLGTATCTTPKGEPVSFSCAPTFNAPTKFVRCQNTKHGEKCNDHFYLKAIQ